MTRRALVVLAVSLLAAAPARARDAVALEIGWRKLQSLTEEASELAGLVAIAPPQNERLTDMLLGFGVMLALAAGAVVLARRRRRARSITTPPVRACASCDASIVEGAHYCHTCGAPTPQAAGGPTPVPGPPRNSRKIALIAGVGLLAGAASTGAVSLLTRDDPLPDPPPSPTTSPTSDVPTLTPMETASPRLVRYRVVNTRSTLRIRRSPSLSAPVVGSARNGEVLTGDGRTVRSDGHVWAAVYLPDRGQLGWVSMRYLRRIEGGGGE